MILLDTDVLIEVQRGTPAAVAWIARDEALDAAVPAAVALEMLIGSRNAIELSRPEGFLATFQVLPFAAGDYERAYALTVAHRLTSGMGLPDFLIAAQP